MGKRRSLETYSKRHLKRLRREPSSSEISSLDESLDGYSQFRRPLHRLCPSSAKSFSSGCAANPSAGNKAASLDSSSDITLPSFSSSDETLEPQLSTIDQSCAPQNVSEENKTLHDTVSTSSGKFNVSHSASVANETPVLTSSGMFNVSRSTSAANEIPSNSSGMFNVSRLARVEEETVINSSGTFNVSRSVSVEDLSRANSSSSGISFLDLSGLLPIADLSPSQVSNNDNIPPQNPGDITFAITYEKLRKFKKELHVYCVENNLTHKAINNLLSLLNSLPPFSLLPKHLALPKDARTLLKSIRKVKVQDLKNGEVYVHIGLAELLRLYYVIVRPVESFSVFVGIDGVPISDSSHGHFTPVMCAIIPEDPDEQSFVSAIRIWYANKTKTVDMNKLIGPFVEEAKSVLKDGVSIDGKQIPVKLFGLTFDAVAKSEILGIIGHGGYWACPRCKIKGVHAGGVDFPGVEDHVPQSHAEFLPGYLQYLKENRIEDRHHQHYTILEQLPGVDLVKDVSLDYMHILCIGCAKYLLRLIATGNSSYSLSSKNVEKVNKRHFAIRKSLPREFARTMKSISVYYKWKATQGRQLILYTGMVTLRGILPENQYENLLLLHAGAFILLHPVLSKDQHYLSKARTFFKEFIVSFTSIYGECHTTYNIHMLKHLTDDAERFVSLTRSSAFQFENFLGKLIHLLRSGNLPLSQAVKRLNEKFCAALVRKELDENMDEGCEGTGVSFSQQHKSGPLIGGLSDPQFYLASFRRNSSPYRMFTPRASTKVKDNCVVMENQEIVLIRNFATSVTGEKFVLFQKFVNKDDFYTTPIPSSELGIYKVSGLSPVVECAPVAAIHNKCALVESEDSSYVAIPLLHSS